MFYIWVQYDKQGEYAPHMTFKKCDKDDALFEIDDLKRQGHRAKFGEKFN
jgi:hypothetical protein